jgi:hypothetical protein
MDRRSLHRGAVPLAFVTDWCRRHRGVRRAAARNVTTDHENQQGCYTKGSWQTHCKSPARTHDADP